MKRWLKIIFIVVCLLPGLFTASGHSPVTPQSDVGKFHSQGKPILLVFSGSDWCTNCIRLNKEVLTDSVFLKFSNENLLLYNADFPQRKKLPADVVKRNELLAERYNPQGYFPFIALLDENENLITNIPYTRQSTDEFISQLNQFLPKQIKLKEVKKKVPAMGSFFEFIIVDSTQNEASTLQLIDDCVAEVNRIENLISEWIPASPVSRINRNAGKDTVSVPPELYALIERSLAIGDLTQGAFDITYQGLSGLWNFDGSQTVPPDSLEILKALDKVDYQKIQLLDSGKVYLPVKGMAIGFGGIGQGYAVDRVKQLLLKKGVQNFVVNSSGDIFANGHKADGSAWKIGIADPFDKEKIIRWLEVDGKAVVSSGNYEKYFEYKGQRYAHILNPKTGWPTQGIMSVTVITSETEVADALATAIFVLGKEVGLDLIDQLPGTDCIIIDAKKNVTYSRQLKVVD